MWWLFSGVGLARFILFVHKATVEDLAEGWNADGAAAASEEGAAGQDPGGSA